MRFSASGCTDMHVHVHVHHRIAIVQTLACMIIDRLHTDKPACNPGGIEAAYMSRGSSISTSATMQDSKRIRIYRRLHSSILCLKQQNVGWDSSHSTAVANHKDRTQVVCGAALSAGQ